MKHQHAKLMQEYADDALETAKPWERWEFCTAVSEWSACFGHPTWNTDVEYRRKVKPREFWLAKDDNGTIYHCMEKPITRNVWDEVIHVREVTQEEV